MEYTQITGTELRVSNVGLGCNNFGMRCDEATGLEVIAAAIDHGINFFDTADIYGGRGKSEQIVGKAIKGLDRTSVLIATKFGNPMSDDGAMQGASRAYITAAVEASLIRLGTDYIDLYQQHIPDPHVPIEETLRALEDLVQQGKVRYIGSSNFSSWQVADADWTSKSAGLSRFVTAQNLYNLIDRRAERELIPACEKFGVDLLPYFPLASGMLTGKYKRGIEPQSGTRLASFGEKGKRAMTDENFDKVERLTAFAEEKGHTILELAISWLACLPYVPSVIAGATSVDQIRQNVAAATWKLSSEEMASIGELSK